jgi:AraC-like DNA-binding protein
MSSGGVFPQAFVHRMKLEEAKRRLAESDARVSEIGFQLGFADANYFARLFKEKIGLTPQQYRQKYRMLL